MIAVGLKAPDSIPLRMASGNQTQSGALRTLAYTQAIYYTATGVWPLIHIDSFQFVTGPKVDRWLVKTVGVLVMVIGAAIGVAGRRGAHTPELVLLGAGSALGLAAIDVVYVARRRISRVYLLDAVGEVGLVTAWAALSMRQPAS